MSSQATPARQRRALGIDIFCRVVDNFGDAGVCWRLATQLASEHGAEVILWIDRPEIIALIATRGTEAQVEVRRWDAATERYAPRDVLLCAFGCELPAKVRAFLSPGRPAPVWINLEYLSAEPWIDGCHLLPSVKPGDLALEWFYYPGFSAASGGLLREAGIDRQRDGFLRSEAGAWLAAHGLDSQPGALRISLFCYPRAPIGELLAELAGNSQRPAHLLLPGGVAEAAVSDFLGYGLLSGQRVRVGALTIARHAFLDQAGYDRLLWSCDLNFVRGEDSWVRAHWADRPFVWQPYPQSEDAHLVKLEAFLTRMLAGASPPAESADGSPAVAGQAGEAELIRAMMLAWSGTRPLAGTVAPFLAALPRLAPLYSSWRLELARRTDLANQLYEFIQTKI